MKKYAFFQGCNIPARIEQYATSTTAVLKKFGIDLAVVRDFNCCGYPARNVDEKAYLLPSVRNIAIAEKLGLDIMVICNCCFASLQKAKNVMNNNSSLQAELNGILAKEGLCCTGTVQIKHFLTVLHDDVGPETLRSQFTKMFQKLAVAVIQGCHVIRPREITQFDNSFVPKITDTLVQTSGAKSLEWRGKLECCGAALAGLNDDLSRGLLAEKVSGALEAGADFVTPICAYCHLQFDTTQRNMAASNPGQQVLPVLLLPQLLGLCLGIGAAELGIEQNSTIGLEEMQKLNALLGPPVEDKKKKRKKVVEPA
jgi:heterodisulfide reductase subunit B